MNRAIGRHCGPDLKFGLRLRGIALLCGWLVAIGVAGAVPARPRYEPPEPPQPAKLFDLVGTEWQGAAAGDQYIAFHAGGSLSYMRGPNRGNASWRMEGNTIYFEINKGYREFRGTMQGNVIRGDSWNKAGKRWATVLQRVSTPR